MEDAGAAAIVMHSLFEEQITREQLGTVHSMESHAESSGEALSYFPEPEDFYLGPEQYLDHVQAIKKAVDVPVIASLNGVTPAGWLRYAKLIEQAGADALELNVYYLATDPEENGATVESRTLEIVKELKSSISMPVAVKLSPYFSSLAHFASQLDGIGVEGLVLFNRFYQPDIDPESLEVTPRLRLSDSSELLLRLRWLAILSGRIWTSLCVTGGVHTAEDAIKAVMAGAHGVQMVSALLRNGPEHLKTVRQEMEHWLEEHEYESLEQMRGSMRLQSSPDPGAFERANYMRVLQSWRQDQTTLL
jgi:dihydroorotate dehydrogenase (fumarate)